jgi:glyoxylase-like metal-dependent hydrolase (beta-lactamase superfamily II)
MIFRQLFDPESFTYTYLIGDPDTRQAVLIDSVREQTVRDMQVLEELDLKLAWVLERHLHADHVTGAAKLQTRTGALSGVSAKAGVGCATRHLQEGDTIEFGQQVISVLETPGHTEGCLSFCWEDRVFTGDALMIGSCGRTDFQGGSADTLYRSISEKLLRLPADTLIYPAHDYSGRHVSSVAQELATNEALQGGDRASFVQFMQQMLLSPPKKIHIALPANQVCGRDVASV